jgi:hypothetical protein
MAQAVAVVAVATHPDMDIMVARAARALLLLDTR